ncbi:bifunctional 2-polyprenyl-6-hydroxyphenol methylase/3-demethylubiquinol 3-O-methyltransferase UbiG [Nitratiruptor sp. YY09-18]|uniref:class I SAM-dependent methyltransferase n=1 Tax=Nitratiruptor sp. YY09-18 TaxID=2724901 RepID=UPI001915BC92|nr:methyltransferase domain-containing protein [Nitratiruptor sp. YY09-18]BCD67747.1 2-polyprenyl-6-hydroxyphenyl methylase / 3-demethylubiquinone-9 3-methyltransferase [Nitratiruptor sp. YY09-18]
MDKAGEQYWEKIWDQKSDIHKIDTNYYTYSLLHQLFKYYLEYNSQKSICEIGCAMSPYLLCFHDKFGYKINGFDYEKSSIIKTKQIYNEMGYEANIFYQDLFGNYEGEKFDILTSFGVFEHFENLENSIAHTKKYIKDNGIIITVIPNMNGIVGFLQKRFNKRVYDIHIPYTKDDLLKAHEKNGYSTLFCDYFGLYQFGVVNIDGIKNEDIVRKIFAIPGKLFYYFYKFSKLRLDSVYNSPYVIYIGKKI